MRFFFLFTLCFLSYTPFFAQLIETPLTNNPVLESAYADRQQHIQQQLEKNDFSPLHRSGNSACVEENPIFNYLTAGESIVFTIDTFGLETAGSPLNCLNCGMNNAGVSVLDTTALLYVADSEIEFDRDTLFVEYCSTEFGCDTLDYVILVKRKGTRRIEPVVNLQAEESILYFINADDFPGDLTCSQRLDCTSDYEGEPEMWVSNSKPNEFFYQASLYRGVDSVCFILCDNFTVCDTVVVPFNVSQQTIDLPFMDDFSYDGPFPDKNKWLDLDPFINNDMAIQPVSVGVATFDGLGPDGIPYRGGFGASDRLTSMYIDLSDASNTDNLYLSFWLQQEGLGDRPEPEDRMQLEFKRDDGTWQNIAQFAGVSDTVPTNVTRDWEYYFYAINDSDFYHDAFQFRFTNYSSRTGILDLWHLDYVRLDRNADRKNVNDVAFTTAPRPILKNYTAMPWNHFEGQEIEELSEFIEIGLYNHFDEAVSVPESSLILAEENATTILDVNLLNGQEANLDSEQYEFKNYSLSSESADVFPPVFNDYVNAIEQNFNNRDSLALTLSYTLDVPSQNTSPGYEAISSNDEVSRTTRFYNYFAHDDGTAESNVVAQNFNNQSVEVAVQFTANVDDTLRAIQMHIPHTTINIETQLLTLKVWIGQLDDEPEYEAIFTRPIYVDEIRDSLQAFTTYNLENELTGEYQGLFIPKGDFFIGWEQFSTCTGTACVPVGYDKNTPEAAPYNYFNANEAGWENLPDAIAPGAIMIRPVVGDITPIPTNTEQITVEENPVYIFPNPTRGIVNMVVADGNYSDYQVAIFNSTGQLIKEEMLRERIDLSNYAGGVYYLKILDKRSQKIFNHKVVVIQ